MRVTWVGGWGVPPESMQPVAEQYFPGAEHTILAPAAESTSLLQRQQTGEKDLLVAWSLGAWRVLEAASRGAQFAGQVVLLAPFLAFPAELQLGGKCSQTQVKFLRRWLHREPLAALADFHQRAGLGNSPIELPYAMVDLLEGLDRLSEDAAPTLRAFAAHGLPARWRAFVGDADPLLDGTAVCRSLPGCQIVPGAGHAIADLLAASQA